jgi:hypothetical protein
LWRVLDLRSPLVLTQFMSSAWRTSPNAPAAGRAKPHRTPQHDDTRRRGAGAGAEDLTMSSISAQRQHQELLALVWWANGCDGEVEADRMREREREREREKERRKMRKRAKRPPHSWRIPRTGETRQMGLEPEADCIKSKREREVGEASREGITALRDLPSTSLLGAGERACHWVTPRCCRVQF